MKDYSPEALAAAVKLAETLKPIEESIKKVFKDEEVKRLLMLLREESERIGNDPSSPHYNETARDIARLGFLFGQLFRCHHRLKIGREWSVRELMFVIMCDAESPV